MRQKQAKRRKIETHLGDSAQGTTVKSSAINTHVEENATKYSPESPTSTLGSPSWPPPSPDDSYDNIYGSTLHQQTTISYQPCNDDDDDDDDNESLCMFNRDS